MYLKRILLILCIMVTPICNAKALDTLVVAQKIEGLITLDPAVLYEVISLEYANNTYQRLVKYNPANPSKPLPEIASSWKVLDNGKTYTFYIKKGLKFASGNPITAHDVAYSLIRVLELKKSPSFYFSQFGLTTKGIVVHDNFTISLHLSEPQSENLFISTLTAPAGAIVDSKLVKQHELNNDWGNKWLTHNCAGSGPFIMTEWRPNEILVFTKNEYYPGEVGIKNVVVRHVAEPTTQRLLLAKGDVDIARDLVDFENIPNNAYLMSEPKSWIQYIALNQNNKYLQIPEVKQAIKYLIDYTAIADTILKHKAITHQSFIPDGFMGVSNTKPFKYNLAQAKQLLKQAGLQDGFRVKLDVSDIELGQAIQAQLAAANIIVDIVPSDSKQIFSKFRNREFEMIISTWAADYCDPHAIAASFLINLDNSLDTDNRSVAWRINWHIPSLSKLTIAASKTQDQNKRLLMYKELQQKFFNEAPLIVMFQKIETIAVSKNVMGFKLGKNADTASYDTVKKSA